MQNSASLPQLLAPELLLNIATFVDTAVDLQNLRLVNRAFSKAATTVLRNGSEMIYLLPTRPSMNRFTKLTQNKLIAPKIKAIVVLYRPPYASPIPSQCQAIAERYSMPQQKIEAIVSEYNDMCVDTSYATDPDAPLQEMNVVESGEFERVLGEGIQRLTSLCSILLRSDLDRSIESSPCLNMPRFLWHCLVDRKETKFNLIQDLTVAEFARYEILRCMHTDRLGYGSPTYVLGALQHWLLVLEGQCHELHFLVSNMGGPCESHWLKGLHNRTSLMADALANITRISLICDRRRPNEELVDLALEQNWCALLRAAVNLETLIVGAMSAWSPGFNNLLHYIFQDCTWAKLAELSIIRDGNIKLLPFEEHIVRYYSLGWYLFRQRDLDSFLMRHKQSLKRLELYNIVGLDQRIPAPPLYLQYAGPGHPEDPTPSLLALDNSLKLWERELDKLTDLRVAVGIDLYENRETPESLDTWLRDSEIQALAETLGAPVEREYSSMGNCNRVIFRLKDSADSIPGGLLE